MTAWLYAADLTRSARRDYSQGDYRHAAQQLDEAAAQADRLVARLTEYQDYDHAHQWRTVASVRRTWEVECEQAMPSR